MIAELALVGAPLVLWALDRWLWAAPAPAQGEGGPSEDPVVGPAYAWLRGWTAANRALLVKVARRLNMNPAALATIMDLESKGDPSVPKKAEGTPRAGLIQITQGAKLPGLDTPAKVWAVREWPIDRQLEEIVEKFYARFPNRSPDQSAWYWYERNFVPALAGSPLEAVVAVRPLKVDSEGNPLEEPNPDPSLRPEAPIKPGQTLTKGQLYAANPGFDSGKRGYWTWGDVKRKVDASIAGAKGDMITVSGKIVGSGPPPATEAPSTAPAAVAPALKTLLRQVNDLYPKRSKASDGGLGDKAHDTRCQEAGSGTGLCDHSEGRAYDFTLDEVNGPNLNALVTALLPDPRVRYIIFDGSIWNPDIEGGARRPYTGSNPHKRHMHVSVKESARGDTSPWNVPAPLTPNVNPGPIPPHLTVLPDVVTAWDKGFVDNVYWKEIDVGPYRVKVATDALSMQGVRLPVTFNKMLELAKRAYYLPLTKAVADARWKAASRKVPLAPLGVPGSPELLAKWPTLTAQAREWSKRIGPKPTPQGELVDGPWKEFILEDGLQSGKAVNYGLRKGDGTVWQSPGHAHNADYTDYSQLWAPMHREATKNGQPVDLVDELSKGAPELMAGKLPDWLKEALQ